MIKKIPSKNIRVGMFLEKIDASWFSTPFLRNQFKISSGQQIKKIKDHGIQEVYINTEKGLDVAQPGPGPMRETQEKAGVEYQIVSVDRLVANTDLPCNLFIKEDGAYSLYLQKGRPSMILCSAN